SHWITRTPRPEYGVLNNPRLLAAAFSSDALSERRNTDAIEVAPDTLLSARVIEHEPARQRSFDEVRTEIEQKVKRDEATRLAAEAGEAALARLNKGEAAGLKWGAARLVSRRNPDALDPAVVRTAMGLDAASPPVYFGEIRAGEGYAIYRISKVVAAAERSDDEARQDLERLRQRAAAAQFATYVSSLRARADVTVNANNFAKAK
ncbi:MAG: peptidylprolyl isomerase, partial [Nitrospirota bacterium]|nr:peptidylprolyl isomerase [Nitrospirota bacterium]